MSNNEVYIMLALALLSVIVALVASRKENQLFKLNKNDERYQAISGKAAKGVRDYYFLALSLAISASFVTIVFAPNLSVNVWLITYVLLIIQNGSGVVRYALLRYYDKKM